MTGYTSMLQSPWFYGALVLGALVWLAVVVALVWGFK